jgi:hypothetical protein
MSTQLTPGKVAGLAAVSNGRGVIAAAALDQRGLLKKMLAREMDGAQPTDSMVSEFKELVTAELTRHASAILLDVESGLPVMKYRNGKGVLLAYEKSEYDATAPEFLPSVTDGWSVLRLREAGATAIKILLYYSPFEKGWWSASVLNAALTIYLCFSSCWPTTFTERTRRGLPTQSASLRSSYTPLPSSREIDTPRMC